MKIDKAHGIALGVVFAALAIYRNPPKQAFEWGDYLMFGLLGLLLFWLLSHRRSGDTAGEDRADQSFAFRLGKALNRVRLGKRI